MEGMDIDDYSRDRSRSPVRERSRSPDRENSRRDYGSSNSRGGDRKERDYGGRRDRNYGGRRGDRGGDRYGDRRGGRGGRDRDYNSNASSNRRDYDSGNSASNSAGGSGEEAYRAKTERNYDNSIFIGNIPFDCTSKDVEEIFKGKFNIIRADIVTNRGQSRGMATVEFSNKDDVRDAISNFDHYDYRGRQIFVRQDYPPPDKKRVNQPRRERDYGREKSSRDDYSERRRDDHSDRRRENNPPKSGTEIFIGNLPFSINWQALKDLMRKAGEVLRADVRLDSWGKSRGFGTVVFDTQEDAERAVEMFQGYEIEGRKLDTRPGRGASSEQSVERDSYESRSSRRDNYSSESTVSKNSEFTEGVVGNGERSDTIFVANLPFATTNDDLYELFETVGRTTKAEIQYNESGKPSGNAVVQFELAELSENAIKNLDNYLYGGRNLNITYASKPEEAQ
ncbi:uncharacterized protein RJT20DRAFT_126523 [Scheffersomyces xylosifermentans]|uniref:uncharacterized protein n=1 Tax=Scheffersomyces xylosifermentans TaxID=1304137 RepID=UPI00315C7EE5